MREAHMSPPENLPTGGNAAYREAAAKVWVKNCDAMSNSLRLSC